MITYLIVCPLVFLAGLVDSIGGGGGLISLPAYLLAGLPAHAAIATNKMGSFIGTTASTARFIKNGFVQFRYALPCLVFSLIGSVLGANLSLKISADVLRNIMIVVLPIVAILVLFSRKKEVSEERVELTTRMYVIGMIAAFIIGIYDGVYGPGTGTFLILAFTALAKTDLQTATGTTKVLNLTSNGAALATFLLHGQVLFPLGIVAGIFCMAGHYIGAGFVTRGGAKVVRPIILVVLSMLFVKIIIGA